LSDGLPKGIVLNVNIPANKAGQIKGIRVCRQADGYWREAFDLVLATGPDPEAVADLSTEQVFKLRGDFVNRDGGALDTDLWALSNQYISVVPSQYDLTAYNMLVTLREQWDIDHH
jgi:5'-nucleotidase